MSFKEILIFSVAFSPLQYATLGTSRSSRRKGAPIGRDTIGGLIP